MQLFDTNIYEAKILCSKIYNPNDITEELMEKWVATFENWEICDSFCMGFFAKSKFALQKTEQWSKREEEFVKRAGFAIMASYGFANKNALRELKLVNENVKMLNYPRGIYKRTGNQDFFQILMLF